MSAPMTCCEEFAHAQQSGSDREEFSSEVKPDGNGGFQIGSTDLPSIKFCPWCGADKRVKHPIETAARRVVDCMYGPKRGEWEDLKAAVAELGTALETHKQH